MSGGDAPKMPDPRELMAANVDQARQTNQMGLDLSKWALGQNRPTQVTPQGKSEWKRTVFDKGAWKQQNPRQKGETAAAYSARVKAAQRQYKLDNPSEWTQTTSLNPEAQKAFDAQQSIQARLSEGAQGKLDAATKQLGTPFDTASLASWASTPKAPSAADYAKAPTYNEAYASRGEKAYYDKAASRLDPKFQQEEQALQTQLASQGLSPGTAAWQQEMDNFRRGKNDAYGNLNRESILTGASLGQDMFGRAMSGTQYNNSLLDKAFGSQLESANFQNAMRGKQFGEAATLRAMPFNELQSLLHGQQVQQPNFGSFVTAQGPSNAAANNPTASNLALEGYQGKLGAYNADQAQTGQIISGIISAVASY